MILERKLVPELENMIRALIHVSSGLPERLPYAEGLNFDRSTGPDFDTNQTDLNIDGTWYSVMGGENTQSCRVTWRVTVETETGLVVATPSVPIFNRSKRRDETTPEMLHRLGFSPRTIGNLGPLEQLFTSAGGSLCNTIQLPNPWMRRVDAVAVRLQMIALFQ